jgi:D-alanine-D-alanine ligase-like ATP-grasp enzyme
MSNFRFDIFIDENCKPWLIEVNSSPSFGTDSPLDLKIKFAVIKDAISILNLSTKRKMK